MQIQKSDLASKPLKPRLASIGLLSLIEPRRVQKVLCVVSDEPGSDLPTALANHEKLLASIAEFRPVELVRDAVMERLDYADDMDVEQIPLQVSQAISVPSKTIGRVFKSVHYLADDGNPLGSRTSFIVDVAIITNAEGYRLLRGPQYPSGIPVLLD